MGERGGSTGVNPISRDFRFGRPPRLVTATTRASGDTIMTAIYISSMIVVVATCALVVWGLLRMHYTVVDGLRSDNKDLRDRLFQKNALPPSGVDLTEKYEARQERLQTRMESPSQGKRPSGPIEKLTANWNEKDRTLVERKGIDATKGRIN